MPSIITKYTIRPNEDGIHSLGYHHELVHKAEDDSDTKIMYFNYEQEAQDYINKYLEKDKYKVEPAWIRGQGIELEMQKGNEK